MKIKTAFFFSIPLICVIFASNKRGNMKVRNLLLLFGVMLLIAACGSDKASTTSNPTAPRLKGDLTVYGLACDGCSDSVVVLLPEDDSDPVTYNIIEADKHGRILGKLQVGDRIAVVPNKKNAHKADLVVDIDRLMGIWCYIVMPTLREAQNLSKAEQLRMIKSMPDSLKETYLIPREYGFYLKPEWEAQSVGYVQEANSLAEESPVVYPPLGFFTGWRMWNGKLIIMSGTPHFGDGGKLKVTNQVTDTCDIDYLDADSLVLSSDGVSRSYYRKNDINDVNARAKAIEQMRSKQALEQTKAE